MASNSQTKSVETESIVVDDLQDDSQDEYEDEVVILELNGVLDCESIRKAARNGELAVRNSNTDEPLIQIGSSIYTGKWNQTLGTDIILQSSNKVVHSGADFGMLSMPSFQSPSIAASQIDLISYSDTRLVAHKALVTSPNERTTHPIVPESTDEEQSKTKTSQTKKKSTKSPEAKKSKP